MGGGVRLRGAERLLLLDDEAEITQNGLSDLANREIVANLGEGGG